MPSVVRRKVVQCRWRPVQDDWNRLTWVGSSLHRDGRDTRFSIVPDRVYPRMWHVRSPDGRLSGMVPLATAKQIAVARLKVEEVSDRRHGT